MAYSVDSLVEMFRSQMDDVAEPYLWDEDRIIEFLDEGQKVFAELTEVFKDTEDLAVTAANPYVTLPANLVRLRRAKLASVTVPLDIINFNELDDHLSVAEYGNELSGDWETATGTPQMIVLDVVSGMGRLVPTPVADDTCGTHFTRLPDRDITASSSQTELTDSRHQRSLILYARHLAYGDHDADVYDPKAADTYEQKFYDQLDAFKGQITRKTRKAGTVRYKDL